MKRYRSTDSFTVNGRWRLPEGEEWHVGQLSFSPEDGFLLHLFSCGFGDFYLYEPGVAGKVMDGLVTAVKPNLESRLTIWGEADGIQITLFEASCLHKSNRVGVRVDSSESSYKTQIGVFGGWIDSIESKVVDRSLIQVDYLNSLVAKAEHLSVSTVFKKGESGGIKKASAEFEIEKNCEKSIAKLGASVEASVESWGYLPNFEVTPYAFESHIREFVQLALDYAEPVGIRSVRSRIAELAALVELVSNQKIGLIESTIRHVDSRNSAPMYLVLSRNCPPKIEDSKLMPHELLVSGNNLDFLELLTKWDSLYDGRKRLLGLLLDLIVPSASYLETKVLLSAVLLEAFHKKTYGKNAGDCLPESIEQFKRSYPKDEYSRGNKENKAAYFKLRILDLYFRLPAEIRAELLEKPSKWIAMTVKLRNSIAHEAFLSEENYQEAFSIARLNAVLIQLHILRELGASADLLVEALRYNKLWSATIRNGREHL